MTPGFRLHARWIIHTVGPVWPARRRFDHDLPAPTEAARPSQPGALLRRSRRFAKAGGHRNNNGKDGHPGEDALLAGCYRHCFSLAETHRIATIAFPSISTGAYRFPVERAARIAWSETRRFLKTNRTLRKVVFVCFDATTYDCYRRIAAEKPVDNEA
ncbi:MAG: macro domain-containing protein [Verrucomicrobia bacterium]|nr:macro domain-containing protein [Verrucomicrobiota bacterium]MBU4290604.1 macro domain-containing protein [Verrucomicrobiota bacterium]MBU4428490.1 macro domain-containing protein [Verrucomicrobiota bacterium]